MLKNIIIFVSGLGIGAGATYLVLKDKFASDSQAEIDEVREYYKKKYEEQVKEETKEARLLAKISVNKPELSEVVDMLKENNYIPNESSVEKKAHPRDDESIYIITAEDFAEPNGNDKETLNYYEEDDILANDIDEQLDIDEYIGREALNHMGDEEPDVVYVRNELLGADYEVLAVHNSYAHIVGMMSYEDD